MESKKRVNRAAWLLTLILLVSLLTPVSLAEISHHPLSSRHSSHLSPQSPRPTSLNSENWALIFAVGVYKNNPDADRPSMLEAADALYGVLTGSSEWQADHIHKLTGSQATGQNLEFGSTGKLIKE